VGKREIPLREGENILGRTDDAVAWIDSPRVLRRHACIIVSAGNATIEDLSKNGTTVSGRRIDRPTPLEGGDQIELGPVLMTFRVFHATGATETQRSRR
jgi:pSer/pThr/pTyr-binding forkhead associated (FHA) protein